MFATARHTRFAALRQCFCGNKSEFDAAKESDQCGVSYNSICTGDSTAACGGYGAISIYKRKGQPPPPTDPPTPSPTPSPTKPPVSHPPVKAYESLGCYKDNKRNWVMSKRADTGVMSAEVRAFQVRGTADLAHWK